MRKSRDQAAASRPVVTSPAIGNPYGSDYSSRRLSSPVSGQQHAAESSGSHYGPRRTGLAEGYPDSNINQQTTTPVTWQSVASRNGDNEFHDRDITHPTGTVHLQHLDLAGAANAPQFRDAVTGRPTHSADHIARDSATGSNGSHSVSGSVTSNAVKSDMIGLDIMKATMRRLDGN